MRLAWEARDGSDAPLPPARTLPAGRYTLVGYRLVDRSRKGEVWHLSASGTKLRTLDVPAQGEVLVAISPRVSVKQRFDGASAGMEIRGSDAAGVSIYKDGRRIPVGYRLLSGEGLELASGKMTYG